MASRYVESRGWERRVFKQPLARRVVKGMADNALQSIIDNIPIVTGSYQDHFAASAAVRRSRASDGTGSAKIAWGEKRWHIIEHGSVNNPPYSPIRRGIQKAGFAFHAS